MNHPVELLETFVAAAQELHFALAAERLHLDPSSVSRRVRQLESLTGVTLFDRSTRSVVLTDAGAALLPVAASALEQLDEVERTIRSLRHAQGVTVSVGLLAHAADSRLLERLTDAATDLALELETTEFGFDDPSAGVRDATSDIGIIFEPIDSDGLVVQRLFEVQRIAILPTRHRFAERREISITDLLDEPWIKPSSTDRTFVDHWLAIEHRGGREPLIGAVAHTSEAGLLAVMSGKGISAGATARTNFHSDGLVTVPIIDLPPAGIAVVTRADADETPARAIADHLHLAYEADRRA